MAPGLQGPILVQRGRRGGTGKGDARSLETSPGTQRQEVTMLDLRARFQCSGQEVVLWVVRAPGSNPGLYSLIRPMNWPHPTHLLYRVKRMSTTVLYYKYGIKICKFSNQRREIKEKIWPEEKKLCIQTHH